MTSRWLSLVFAGLCMAGCVEETETHPVAEHVLWAPDALGAGPRLWLEASRGDEAAAGIALTVWGAELGGVFGWSAHVSGFDAALVVEQASVEPHLGTSTEAMLLAAPRPGDVALGGTRLRPELGDVDIDEPARLAEVRLLAPSSVVSRVELARAIVRRADGSYVPVTAAGGELDTEGGL